MVTLCVTGGIRPECDRTAAGPFRSRGRFAQRLRRTARTRRLPNGAPARASEAGTYNFRANTVIAGIRRAPARAQSPACAAILARFLQDTGALGSVAMATASGFPARTGPDRTALRGVESPRSEDTP